MAQDHRTMNRRTQIWRGASWGMGAGRQAHSGSSCKAVPKRVSRSRWASSRVAHSSSSSAAASRSTAGPRGYRTSPCQYVLHTQQVRRWQNKKDRTFHRVGHGKGDGDASGNLGTFSVPVSRCPVKRDEKGLHGAALLLVMPLFPPSVALLSDV